MKRILQGLLLIILMATTSSIVLAQVEVRAGAGGELQGKYKPPTINRRLFGDALSMVNNERDEYATNLAAIAVKMVQSKKGSQASLDLSRQFLGLALHLSPRNRKSVVVNRLLTDGLMPDKVVADYESEVFAKLLLARGQLLEKQKGDANALLSRYFIALAAIIDPRNEDAIYESEMRRIDHGELSWAAMTDGKTKRVATPKP